MRFLIIPESVTIRVEFPALSELVTWLKANQQQQAQVDALAAQVEQLTAALKQSTTGLGTAVEENN